MGNKQMAEKIFREVYHIQDPELLEQFVLDSHAWKVSRKSTLLHAGCNPDYLFFLIEGVVRGFFLDREGKDITDCLFADFGAAIWPSMGIDDAARINLEAVSDCTVLCLPVKTIQRLMFQFTEIMVVYNRLLEHSLAYHWELKIMMYQCTAQERYAWFLQKYPGIIDQISHRYIASFLGMNPVTLSRLRRQCRDGG